MKELFGPFALVSLLIITAPACTGSEPIGVPGSGGHAVSGSGGAATGSGGAGADGTGGRTSTGSGGATGGTTGGGSGGARPDAGKDVSTADADGAAGDGGEMILSYDVDIAYMLFFSCGGCHLSTSTQGNFDMKIASPTAPGSAAYTTITANVNAEHAACTRLDPASKKRVVPFKPDNSLLYIKISTASPPSGCGKHMPDGASMTPEQIAKIRTWITQGAKP